jgi:hypothetical protein
LKAARIAGHILSHIWQLAEGIRCFYTFLTVKAYQRSQADMPKELSYDETKFTGQGKRSLWARVFTANFSAYGAKGLDCGAVLRFPGDR